MRVIRELWCSCSSLAIAYFVRRLPQGHRPSRAPASTTSSSGITSRRARGKHGKGAAAYTPTFQWPVLWARSSLLLAAVGRVALVAEERVHRVADAFSGRGRSRTTSPASIERRDRRPRVRARRAPRGDRRVRADGGRVRHATGSAGSASETPTEYLQRILLGLTTRVEAVGRLTGLFEQAKFSDHPIDGRDEAGRDRRAPRDPRRSAGWPRHEEGTGSTSRSCSSLSSGACAYVALAGAGRAARSPSTSTSCSSARCSCSSSSRGVGAAAPRARRSDLAAALDERRSPSRSACPQLAKVEREVTLAIGNAYDLHSRLLPHLREIATARLERRGQRPGPDTLGRWWELLRPDRPEPSERFAPGIREAELRDARRRPGAALMDLAEVGPVGESPSSTRSRRPSSASATRSSCCCSACSPTGTCCSRTTPVSRRR